MRPDAKDLAQEAFVRVWKALRRIEPDAALEGWLYRIVTNLYIDLLRRRPKTRVQSLDEPIATSEGQMAREQPDPAADVERAALDKMVDRRRAGRTAWPARGSADGRRAGRRGGVSL